MDYKLEVVVVPVSDVDRAKQFYCDQVGFHLDVDHAQGDFRVVQMTPTGSACSITIGTGLVDSVPAELAGFRLSKGTIQFKPDHPIPADLVARIVRARMAETDAAAEASGTR